MGSRGRQTGWHLQSTQCSTYPGHGPVLFNLAVCVLMPLPHLDCKRHEGRNLVRFWSVFPAPSQVLIIQEVLRESWVDNYFQQMVQLWATPGQLLNGGISGNLKGVWWGWQVKLWGSEYMSTPYLGYSYNIKTPLQLKHSVTSNMFSHIFFPIS